MSKKTSSRWKAIKCPFFHSDEIKGGNNNHIMCEDSTRTSIIRQTFVSADDLRKWEHRYCTDIKACENCPEHNDDTRSCSSFMRETACTAPYKNAAGKYILVEVK